MIRFFNIMMLVLEGLLGAGCIALGFLEHGALPKLLYILGGILLLPILPLRKKIEDRCHIHPYVIPVLGFILIIAAVFLTPIH